MQQRQTVGATMTMMQSPENSAYFGDLAGHAALVLAVAQLENPPSSYSCWFGCGHVRRACCEHGATVDKAWKALGETATFR